MYFPYLRGRRFELLAVRSSAQVMAKSGKIVPLIEPVSTSLSELNTALNVALGLGVRVAVITNPQVGALRGGGDPLQSANLRGLLSFPSLIPAFAVGTGTAAGQVAAFLKQYKREVCFVHLETPAAALVTELNSHSRPTTHVVAEGIASSHAAALAGSLVSLSDKFNRLARNAAYPADEFFSDAHMTLKGKKLIGFSDYSIVGDFFTNSGGPAHAVAIHLHHEEQSGLWLRHFVSNSTHGTANTPGKFAEAVAKLNSYAAKNPSVASTAACATFRSHHNRQHFPGLGVVKQLSIQHHIETLAAIL